MSERDEFRVLFEFAPDLAFTQDLAGRITRVNRGFERLTGHNRGHAIGRNVLDFVVPEHQDKFRQEMMARMGGGTSSVFEIDWVSRQGRVSLELSIELFFHNGTPAGMQVFGRDTTAKQKERTLRAAAEDLMRLQTQQLATFSRYLELLHRLSTTTYASLDDLFRKYLTTGCEIFNVRCGAILERTGGKLKARTTCEPLPEFAARIAERVFEQNETLVRLPSGESPIFSAAAPLVQDGAVTGVLGFWSETGPETHPQAREIIEMMARGIVSAIHQRRLTERLEYLAKHDALTGLPNRFLLTEQMDLALKQAHAGDMALGVVFLDLDNFKEVNDTFGHEAGDAVLHQVATRLANAAPSQCWLARVGGDEFVGLVPGIRDAAEAVAIGSRVLNELSAPVILKETELHITASAGVSVYPADGRDSDTLLRKADTAMYNAKLKRDGSIQKASP